MLFSSRSLERVRFQFTHPRGVRLSREESVPMRRWFQFTHPRGVRRASSLAICTLWSTFQFTHPRGVRQQLVTEGSPGSVVSIHAPTRGATPPLSRVRGVRVVSIHAPTRGATHRRSRAGHSPGCFNSRTREGCDCRDGEVAVELPLQTCFSEGTQIIPSIRCREHLNPYNRMSMSACECLANC